MIRFACPRCKTVLERPEHESGTKFSCPGCQQRLQVPAPPENKTVLGNLVLPTTPSAEQKPTMGIKVGPLPAVAGRCRRDAARAAADVQLGDEGARGSRLLG